MTTRYSAPEELLHRFADSIAPLQPPAGWLGAVAEAIEAGLDEGEPFPWPAPAGDTAAAGAGAAAAAAGEDGRPRQPLPPPQQQQPQTQQQQGQPAGLLPPPPPVNSDEATALLHQMLMPFLVASGTTPEAATQQLQAAAAAAAAAVQQQGQGPQQQQLQPPQRMGSLFSSELGGTGSAAAPARQLKGYTVASQQRLAWVLEVIAVRGFMLASEMPRYLKVLLCTAGAYCLYCLDTAVLQLLPAACWTQPGCQIDRGCLLRCLPVALQERADAEGDTKSIMPDRRTCDRIIERGQKEGHLQVGDGLI